MILQACYEPVSAGSGILRCAPGGDRAAIEAEARRLLHAWGTPEGGFILGDYGDEAAIGARLGTREFMMETFRRLDPYRGN